MAHKRLNNTAVMILGMHRSGTSAVAGVLQRMGVYLGTNLMAPAADNPRGFYEHNTITNLHDELLQALGSSWDDPRPLPEGWERSPEIDAFKERLKVILTSDFRNVPLWGVKDPRLCRLLPYWLPLLHELGVAPKALLLPITLIPFVLIVIGFTWGLASIGVFLRDISQLIGIIVTAFMFIAPIFYPIESVPEKFRAFLYFNPVTLAVEEARDVTFFDKIPSIPYFLIYLACGLIIAWLGFVWFQKTRKGFADVL